MEEEKFTNKIIEAFNTGTIDLPESASGITLRAYLAEKLGCDPMRITKKYTGTSCLGKRVYHCDVSKASPESIDKVKSELKELEIKFKEKLEQTNREKHESELSVAEFQNHLITTPGIDAMMQNNSWGSYGLMNMNGGQSTCSSSNPNVNPFSMPFIPSIAPNGACSAQFNPMAHANCPTSSVNSMPNSSFNGMFPSQDQASATAVAAYMNNPYVAAAMGMQMNTQLQNMQAHYMQQFQAQAHFLNAGMTGIPQVMNSNALPLMAPPNNPFVPSPTSLSSMTESNQKRTMLDNAPATFAAADSSVAPVSVADEAGCRDEDEECQHNVQECGALNRNPSVQDSIIEHSHIEVNSKSLSPSSTASKCDIDLSEQVKSLEPKSNDTNNQMFSDNTTAETHSNEDESSSRVSDRAQTQQAVELKEEGAKTQAHKSAVAGSTAKPLSPLNRSSESENANVHPSSNYAHMLASNKQPALMQQFQMQQAAAQAQAQSNFLYNYNQNLAGLNPGAALGNMGVPFGTMPPGMNYMNSGAGLAQNAGYHQMAVAQAQAAHQAQAYAMQNAQAHAMQQKSSVNSMPNMLVGSPPTKSRSFSVITESDSSQSKKARMSTSNNPLSKLKTLSSPSLCGSDAVRASSPIASSPTCKEVHSSRKHKAEGNESPAEDHEAASSLLGFFNQVKRANSDTFATSC